MPVREGGPAPGWVLRPEVVARLHGTMHDAVSAVGGPGSGPSPAGPSPAGLWTEGSGSARQQLRPAVALAVAAIGGRTIDDPGVLPAAAVAELLHSSTLGDGPASRGDLLVAAAIRLASHVGPEAGVLIAETLAHLCSGQALQDQLRYDAGAPTHRLMEVIRLTAGSLFRAACLLGAMASGSGPEFRTVAAGFGMDLGICVQLADDLLDVAPGPSPGGVPAAGDFASGTVTLPIALAIRDCPELGGLLRPGLSQASRARAARLLSNSRAALTATAATARTYANGAGMRLGAVASGPVAGDLDLASQVAQWPAAYLDSQLRADMSGRYRWLAAPLAGAFR